MAKVGDNAPDFELAGPVPLLADVDKQTVDELREALASLPAAV